MNYLQKGVAFGETLDALRQVGVGLAAAGDMLPEPGDDMARVEVVERAYQGVVGPGTITEVRVKVGDTVKEGETVIVLEAMKMQNNIEAEASGTITSVLVGQGETVMEGATLVTIE